MSNNQDPNQQHIIYQQSYQTYPAGAGGSAQNTTMGTWGQPQPQVGAQGVPETTPSIQQAVPYAFPYQPTPDMSSYNDKSGYGGAYPVQYAGGDADYYRSQNYYNPQQAPSNQWAQGSYPGYSNQQPIYGTYPDRGDQARGAAAAAAFTPGALPNMSRPPPNIKENIFHNNLASLSLLENPAQSAAAYTASWVSSTSSIPPELKDEPEVFGGLDRDVFNSQNFNDQFAGLQLTDAQKVLQDAARKEHQQQQAEQRARPRDVPPPRELTWEERVRKAQVQKERVETQHRGGGGAPVEREPKPEREAGNSRGGGGGGQRPRGGPTGSGGPRRGDNHRQHRGQQHQTNNPTPPVNNHMMWKNSDSAEQQRIGGENEGNQQIQQGRLNYNRQPTSMPPIGGPASPMQQQAHIASAPMPHMYNQGPMMMRNRNPGYGYNNRPMPAQQQHLMGMQQDERFKNTWLDASAFVHPFPLPFPGNMNVGYAMDGNRGGNRGRGRGGGNFGGYRGMNRGGFNRRDRRDERRDDREDHSSPEDKSPKNEENVQPVHAEEPTSFESQP